MADESPLAEAPRGPSKQSWKMIIELAPIVVFGIAYVYGGIYWATGAIMVAMFVALAASQLALGHIPRGLIATFVLVEVLGAATLWLQDPRFIKMKPTIIYAFFGAALLAGLASGRPFIKMLLGEALKLTDAGWRQLTLRFAMFFFALAGLNEFIWRNLSEDIWATFKVVGIIPLIFIFFACQIGLIRRHSIETSEKTDHSAIS